MIFKETIVEAISIKIPNYYETYKIFLKILVSKAVSSYIQFILNVYIHF